MKKIKTISFLCLVSILISLFSFNAFALDEYAWYCKRSGRNQPEISEEELLISKYSAYSIDRSVDDTSERKVIYLTFDCGYENGNTAKILDTLEKENVPAAFFLLDNIILQNTDLVTRMVKSGHLVCNHTKNHKNLCAATKEEIADDLSELEKIYEENIGAKMTKYFRFPEGKYSESALKSVSELGYKTIFWSFAYDDWDNARQMRPEKAIKKILNNTHNGAVMLFHPTSKVNANIMPVLITEWRKMGYTFGTLDELTCKQQIS